MHHDSASLHCVSNFLPGQVVGDDPAQAGLAPCAVIALASDDSEAASSPAISLEGPCQRGHPAAQADVSATTSRV